MMSLIIIIYMVLNYAELSSGTVALLVSIIVVNLIDELFDYIQKKNIDKMKRKIDLLEREKLNYLTNNKK